MFYKKIKINSAFTLIELMVATTLFTIIMLMGVGSLITSSNSSKNAQKLRIAVDNINFAMESMARELRTGTSYLCGTGGVSMADINAKGDCTSSENGNAIAFTPQQTTGAPTRVAYRLNNGKIERCENNVSSCVSLISNDVNIEKIKFVVLGSLLSPNTIQPSVKIFIRGVVNVDETPTPFILQTIASQRSSEQQ